jgi:hypothetical protein
MLNVTLNNSPATSWLPDLLLWAGVGFGKFTELTDEANGVMYVSGNLNI